MNEDLAFRNLMRRVQQGDEQAATELVKRYEAEIRRAVRLRLTDNRLGRVLDSMDICQSVLGNFFMRAAGGQFDLNNPAELLKLLVTMARNKLTDHARRHTADRRDQRRMEFGADERMAEVPATCPTPSEIIGGQELLAEARRRMSAEESYLAEQRAAGRDWAELADELGESAEALRKRLTRAMDRIAGELGLN